MAYPTKHEACCKACAAAQDAGTMPRGATCSPCGGSWQPSAGIPSCEPFDYDEARIDLVVQRLFHAGAASLDQLDDVVPDVLAAVYPTTSDGRPIVWSSLSHLDSTCLLRLWNRVRARVAYVLATLEELNAAQRWEEDAA